MNQQHERDGRKLLSVPRRQGEAVPDLESDIGLSGPGTEGTPGPPKGETEPQIPQDESAPLESQDKLHREARRLAKDPCLDLNEEYRTGRGASSAQTTGSTEHRND